MRSFSDWRRQQSLKWRPGGYPDERAHTPWGDTRPDYGRGEVRQYILDNARMWLEEYHVDGLRFDGTVYIHTPNGPGSADLPDGWSLLQAVNSLVAQEFPGRITIAEDLQNNAWLTKDVGAGGAGFGSQRDANFVHPPRIPRVGMRRNDHRAPISRPHYDGFPYHASLSIGPNSALIFSQ